MNYPQNDLVRSSDVSRRTWFPSPSLRTPVTRDSQDSGRPKLGCPPFGGIYGFFFIYMEHVILYIQETHLGLLLFWIIRTRGMICDESALKFFESPMIILYGSLRFSRFMCPRILILFHFKTLKNIWTERETEYSSKNKFWLHLRLPFMTSLWTRVAQNDLGWPRMTLMWLIEK